MLTSRTLDSTALCPSLAEFKAHIRITGSDMDTDLTAKLKAAIMAAENYMGRRVAKSTYVENFYEPGLWPEDSTLGRLFKMEAEKVGAVTKIEYKVDRSSSWVEASDFGEYYVTEDEHGFYLDPDITGPTKYAIRVTYTAGYTVLPEDVKAAILMHAATLFNNPLDTVESLPKTSTNLLRPYAVKYQLNPNSLI